MSQPSFDLEIDPTPTFRVSELTASIGTAVRRSFPEELWVRGEIDSLSRSGAGHIYFDLVEGMGNERVALRVTLFRSVAVVLMRRPWGVAGWRVRMPRPRPGPLPRWAARPAPIGPSPVMSMDAAPPFLLG